MRRALELGAPSFVPGEHAAVNSRPVRRSVVTAVLAAGATASLLAGCGAGKVAAPTGPVYGKPPTQAAGDATAGKAAFNSNGCNACHTYKPAGSTAKVGPDLDNLAADAKKANQGSVAEYAKTSIVDPNAYVAPGYPKGVMPSFQTLPAKTIANLVAFLTKPSS